MSWTKIQTLNGANPQDNYGESVSIDGNYMIIGAPNSSTGNGYGYIQFWKLVGKRKWEKMGNDIPGIETGEQFGYSVSISGIYAVAGAPLYGTTDTGRIDIFKLTGNNWERIQRINGDVQDRLGQSVSISNKYILAGAPGSDLVDTTGNKAYFYKKGPGNIWNQVQKIENGVSALGKFGFSVSINGNEAMISNCKGGNTTVDGRVTWYRLNNSGSWENINFVTGRDKNVFGYSVSVEGNFSIVGEVQDLGGAQTRPGAIKLYKKENKDWVQTQVKYGHNANDHYGSSVEIGGNYVYVGADNFEGGYNKGKAYFYDINNSNTLTANGDPEGISNGDFFGRNVSVSGNYAAVGAYQYDTGTLANKEGYVILFYKS
jgi:hypothetical protein